MTDEKPDPSNTSFTETEQRIIKFVQEAWWGFGIVAAITLAAMCGIVFGLAGELATDLGPLDPEITTRTEVALYLLTGGVWAFLFLWAIRRR